MSASVVDICNLSLSRLGDKGGVTSINPPEGSSQAANCARFYPLARDVALSSAPWNFNTTRETGALLDTAQAGWQYAYATPNKCLKVIKVIPGYTDWSIWQECEGWPFEIETDDLTGLPLILTDLVDATIVFQRQIEDPTLFPPKFVTALSWLLCSYLAGAVIRGAAGIKAGQASYAAYMTEISSAGSTDANQRKGRAQRIPDALAARGYGADYSAYPNFRDGPVSGPYGFYAYPDGLGNG